MKLYSLAYASKEQTFIERRYPTLEKECLAIKWGTTKLRLCLAGKMITLRTDYQPLACLNKTEYRSNRIMRWALVCSVIITVCKMYKGRMMLSPPISVQLSSDVDCTCTCLVCFEIL